MKNETKTVIQKVSLNRFILESYKEDRALKTVEKNGFAMVSQKISLKGLRLLADANIMFQGAYGFYPAGSIAYVKEGALQSAAWAKIAFTAEGIEGEFIIADPLAVEFVQVTKVEDVE